MDKQTKVLSVVVAFILSITILCTSSFAFQNKPNWIREYPWGIKVKDFPFRTTKSHQTKQWKRLHINAYFVNGVGIGNSNPILVAIDGKVEALVCGKLSDKSMFDVMRWIVEDFGKPTQIDSKNLVWIGDHTFLMLSEHGHTFMLGSIKGTKVLGELGKGIKDGAQ